MSKQTVLYIPNWNQRFENHRSRTLTELHYVPMPNRHDGAGYSDLLDHRDGVAHYGVWCLIAQVASRCHPRGVLLRTCTKHKSDVAAPENAGPIARARVEAAENGAGAPESAGHEMRMCKCAREPHTAGTLARMTHGRAKVFSDAIKRLIDIGWLGEFEFSDISELEAFASSGAEAPENAGRIAPENAGRMRARAYKEKKRNRRGGEKTAPTTPAVQAQPGIKGAEVAVASSAGPYPMPRFDDPPRPLFSKTAAAMLKAVDEQIALVKQVAAPKRIPVEMTGTDGNTYTSGFRYPDDAQAALNAWEKRKQQIKRVLAG